MVISMPDYQVRTDVYNGPLDLLLFLIRLGLGSREWRESVFDSSAVHRPNRFPELEIPVESILNQ